MSGFESIGEDGERDPLDSSPVGSIGSRFDAGKVAAELIGPQLDMAKLAGLQLSAAKMASTLIASQLGMAKLAAPQLGAAKMASTLITSQLGAANLAGLQLGAAKMASTLIGPYLDPLIGLTELERLLAGSSVLPGVDHSVAALDREQMRQLWGQYIYVQVWILCALLLLFCTMKLGSVENGLLAVIMGATGASGNTVASKARKIAVNNFDLIFPPGRDMPAMFNTMI